MKDNIIKTKTYNFAIRIVGLYKYLTREKKEYILSKQILKSGTSIGANVEEADGGQSKKDFFAKISIAYKESKETHYWLRILRDTNFITKHQAEYLLKDLEEILKIITKIQITTKKNIKIN